MVTRIDAVNNVVLYGVPLAAICALVFAYAKARWIKKQDAGTDRMKEIAGFIREGANAFLRQEYKVLVIFVLVVAALLAFANWGSTGSSPLVALSFIVGALCSAAAGFFGMQVATRANVRTANAARTGLSKALSVAFSGGAVMGMCVVGLGLLGVTSLFLLYTKVIFVDAEMHKILEVLTGFSFGASSIALFARVGGGIYTKAADVGADLVGKVEAGIPEDDPRNPATIADNVGDNVGDVAGMGADLFESYVGAIIGSSVLGVGLLTASGQLSLEAVVLPIILAGAGIIISILCTTLVRTHEGGNPQHALDRGTIAAAIIMAIATYVIAYFVLPRGGVSTSDGHVVDAMGITIAVGGGLIAGTLIGKITEFYTSDTYNSVKNIAKASETGTATNVIQGIAVGMISPVLPVVLIVLAIICAYVSADLYGIALAALGMLATTGIQLAVDAYGPIADNAGGIAEMSKLPHEVRERTDKLDSVGNTTAAIGKGFAIGSAALTALSLFVAYSHVMGLTAIDVLDPFVISGLFVGGVLPFWFSALSMLAVGRSAGDMIIEVRRQFKEIPGLLDGDENARPEYGKCVAISTKAAIHQMILPGTIAIFTPVLAGIADIIAGTNGAILGGVLVGVTITGVVLAIFMANSGGAWDNAKKYIESGHHGGKGSEAHKAAVVGDTVGDPFKDTAGPSLNILIKLMSVIALVLAPVFVSYQDKPVPLSQGEPAHLEVAAPQQAAQALPERPSKRVDMEPRVNPREARRFLRRDIPKDELSPGEQPRRIMREGVRRPLPPQEAPVAGSAPTPAP